MNVQRAIALILFFRVVTRLPLTLWIQAMSASLQSGASDGDVSLGAFTFAINLARGLDFVFALCLTLAFSVAFERRAWRAGAAAGLFVLLVESGSFFLGETIQGSRGLSVAVSMSLVIGWLAMQLAATRARPALVALGLMAFMVLLEQALPLGAMGPAWIGAVVSAVAGIVIAAMAWREPCPASTR